MNKAKQQALLELVAEKAITPEAALAFIGGRYSSSIAVLVRAISPTEGSREKLLRDLSEREQKDRHLLDALKRVAAGELTPERFFEANIRLDF